MSIKDFVIRILERLGHILVISLLSAGPLLADGKMYSEKVNTTIPYQRALILFDEGKETLVIQSQYQIPGNSGKHTLGWVVPVPAVPEIASMDANYADELFQNLDSMSGPEFTNWGFTLFLGLFFLLIAVVIIAVLASFVPKFIHQKSLLRKVGFASAFAAFVLFITAPMIIHQRKGIDGVEVIKSEKVGIFDTKVIRSESPKELLSWFKGNSFDFDQSDESTIQSYIDRKWCFVTAKVDASINAEDKAAVSNKLLAPLILNFPVSQPVYPTALTATAGQSTEVLLYLLTTGPMKTTSALADRFQNWVNGGRIVFQMSFVKPEDFIEKLPFHIGYLNKYKATLTPAQMIRDIEFTSDSTAEPFREHIHRW